MKADVFDLDAYNVAWASYWFRQVHKHRQIRRASRGRVGGLWSPPTIGYHNPPTRFKPPEPVYVHVELQASYAFARVFSTETLEVFWALWAEWHNDVPTECMEAAAALIGRRDDATALSQTIASGYGQVRPSHTFEHAAWTPASLKDWHRLSTILAAA